MSAKDMSKERQPASPREYLQPFFRRYRRLFWFDGILAVLHLPLLAWLLSPPAAVAGAPLRAGWLTSVTHVSLAFIGIVANVLLLRRHCLGPLAGYAKSAYAVAIRVFIGCLAVWSLGRSIDPPWAWADVPHVLEVWLPVWLPWLLVFVGYHSLYVWCVHLNVKWTEQLRMTETADNDILMGPLSGRRQRREKEQLCRGGPDDDP